MINWQSQQRDNEIIRGTTEKKKNIFMTLSLSPCDAVVVSCEPPKAHLRRRAMMQESKPKNTSRNNNININNNDRASVLANHIKL